MITIPGGGGNIDLDTNIDFSDKEKNQDEAQTPTIDTNDDIK